MSFGGSACPWCLGHSRRGGAAKTWQLLQQDSLGSFKMPFSVTSGMFNNRSSHQCAQTCGFSCFVGFFVVFSFRANHKDTETHGRLLTRKCKSFIKIASASAPIPSPAHSSPIYAPVATEAAKVAMLKVVPRPALNNSQRMAFPKTSPGACTAPPCISPGYDQPTLIILCPLEQKGQFPSLTARPYFKHLWGFTSLLGQVRYLGEILSLLINPCLLL